MRVEDLIAELSAFDPKAEVQVSTGDVFAPPEIWEHNGVVRLEGSID